MISNVLEELNVTQAMLENIIFIGCVLLLAFLITCFVESGKNTKTADEYKNKFQQSFESTKDIRRTMLELSSTYPDKSKESKALKAGINYLDHSIMRDYAGAFHYIETYFNNESIKQMHREYIEKAQKMKLLMITKSND